MLMVLMASSKVTVNPDHFKHARLMKLSVLIRVWHFILLVLILSATVSVNSDYSVFLFIARKVLQIQNCCWALDFQPKTFALYHFTAAPELGMKKL